MPHAFPVHGAAQAAHTGETLLLEHSSKLHIVHIGKACAVGVAMRSCPAHNGADSMHVRCVHMHQTPLTYHGGGSPAVWPGDVLPGAFRDHGLNSEGVSGLHHPNGLVLCRQQW